MNALNVTKVTIVRRAGYTDQVYFRLEGPSPFPEMEAEKPGNYPPNCSVEVRRGYAEEWLRGMGFDPSKVELIEA
jgi:hypothetical protein